MCCSLHKKQEPSFQLLSSPPHFNYSLVGKIRLCTSCQVTPQHGHVPLQDAGNDLGHDHLGAVGEAAGSKCGI